MIAIRHLEETIADLRGQLEVYESAQPKRHTVAEATEHFERVARCRNLQAFVVPSPSDHHRDATVTVSVFSDKPDPDPRFAAYKTEYLWSCGCLSLNEIGEFEIDVHIGGRPIHYGVDVSMFRRPMTSLRCYPVEWGVFDKEQPLVITARKVTSDPNCKLMLAVYGQTKAEVERIDRMKRELKTVAAEDADLDDQVEELSECIMRLPINEPSRNEGAIDTAIRLLNAAYSGGQPVRDGMTNERAFEMVKGLRYEKLAVKLYDLADTPEVKASMPPFVARLVYATPSKSEDDPGVARRFHSIRLAAAAMYCCEGALGDWDTVAVLLGYVHASHDALAELCLTASAWMRQ